MSAEPEGPQPPGERAQDLFARGERKRRKVVGDEYVERALGGVTDFDRDWQRVLTEYCWGEVWNGTALTDRQRSLQTLCLLGALNRGPEFETHFRGALRNGCTPEELRETLLQIAIYAGVPAGVEAFRIARQVLAETDQTA